MPSAAGWFNALPDEPGTYAIGLRLARPARVTVGRLGRFAFRAGLYVYVGSARGPGGLRARLGRHLRQAAKPHWHIDTLRAVASVRGVLYTMAPEPLECVWAQRLSRVPGALIPVGGFGASDCRAGCEGHLIAIPPAFEFSRLQACLQKVSGGEVIARACLLN